LQVCAEVKCGLKDEFLEIKPLLPVSFTDGVLCAQVELVASEWATEASAEGARETADRWAAGARINRGTDVLDLDPISDVQSDNSKWYDLLAVEVIYDVRTSRVLLRRVDVDRRGINARDRLSVAVWVGSEVVGTLVVVPTALDGSTDELVLEVGDADGDYGQGGGGRRIRVGRRGHWRIR
jgi:hypothetical protein